MPSPATSAAGTTLDEVVNVRIYCANTAWYGVINEVYATFFDAPEYLAHPEKPDETLIAVG